MARDDISVNTDIVPNGHRVGSGVSLRPFAQNLGAFFFAVVVPAMIGPDIFLWKPGQYPSQDNTIILTIVALMTGMYFFRRVVKFPGVSSSIYIIPTFALVYAVVMLAVLFARIDYSRFQLGLSFLLCISWFYLLHYLTNRTKEHNIAIVPSDGMEQLKEFSSIRWTELRYPSLQGRKITCVVADLRAQFSDEWIKFIADCAVSGIPVYHVKQLRESLTGRVEIEHLSENNLGNLLPNLAYLKVKRIIDFCLALLVLPVVLPLIAVICVIIKTSDGGPVFFTQRRVGYRGRDFNVYKFRTMREDPNRDFDVEGAITKENDTRITRLGAKLRRTRLDELPQVFNILLGDMSWIGPRPEAKVLSEWYEAGLPFYSYRFVVPPGISGWAQVNQGHVTSIERVNSKLQYDFYYIKNFSPWLDILIALKTVRIIFSGNGAR